MANRSDSPVLRILGMLASLLVAAAAAAQPSGGAVSSPAEAAAADARDANYRIGAGDVLQIFVWRQDDLSVTVTVRPDGKITTPLIDDLVAVGKTPTQLAREMEEALSAYLRSPQVNVMVKEFVGLASDQVRVIGQAVSPKAVAYREGMTVLDVVIEVGGLTEFAAGNRSRVVRTVNGKTEEIRVRLDDLTKRGRIERNITMKPGDVLVIPERVF